MMFTFDLRLTIKGYHRYYSLSIGSLQKATNGYNPLIDNCLQDITSCMSADYDWKESVREALSRAQSDGLNLAHVARLMDTTRQSLSQFISKGKLGSNKVRWLEDFLVSRGHMKRPVFPEAFYTFAEPFTADDMEPINTLSTAPSEEGAAILAELARKFLSPTIDDSAKKDEAVKQIEILRQRIIPRLK